MLFRELGTLWVRLQTYAHYKPPTKYTSRLLIGDIEFRDLLLSLLGSLVIQLELGIL